MIPSPLPYDVRWTCKLLRRDVRGLKNKFANKLKSKSSKGAKASAPPHQEEFDAVIVEPESSQRTTERSETEDQKSVSTLYELLETKLKESYASRDRDMLHGDRWRFRGSWLLLHAAVQACPSNDSYTIFEDAKAQNSDETKLLLELLQLSTAKTSSEPATKISHMPAEPYTKRNSDHGRYDSAFSRESFGPSPPRQQAKPTGAPPPSQIWHSILQAACNGAKTASVAEDILSYVWPEKNAAEVLDQIGHPSKRLGEDEFAELREKLRVMLFPEYKTLAKRC